MIDIVDWLLLPFYIGLILGIAYFFYQKQRPKNEVYRYFFKGLLCKIIGGIALSLIYVYYYKGGDTINYYQTAVAFKKVFLYKGSEDFYTLITRFNAADYYYNLFNDQTGYPQFQPGDTYAMFVSKLYIILTVLCFDNFLAMAAVMAAISYIGAWKLFRIFSTEFPRQQKQLAIAFLFMPSVLFWGSGILKDTITLTAVYWFVIGFYQSFVNKSQRLRGWVNMLLSLYFIVKIKPYIFIALIPAALITLARKNSYRIRNGLLRTLALPIFVAISAGLAYVVFLQSSSLLGSYAADNILNKASVTQKDLKREAYGANSFDIGDFDATPTGILAKTPVAIMAALYMPTVLQVRNIVMLFSATENLAILLLTLACIYYFVFRKRRQHYSAHPLVIFSLVFALFFAFSVGLTNSNFGALVRLKIPQIPFFVSYLILFRAQYQPETKKSSSLTLNRRPVRTV